MEYYPVLIPTLNRYNHFKKCIDSLSKCTYANKTDLLIGLDFPPDKKYEEGYIKIKQYIKTINGFKSVTVFERTENFGALRNSSTLVEYAKTHYDAYIFSEDDNLFAPTFLEFMNSSLMEFKNKKNITSVCGFLLKDLYNPKLDYILSPDYSAWGTGVWVDKLKSIDQSFVKATLSSYVKSWKIFQVYPLCLKMLMDMYSKQKWYGDTVKTAYNILNNEYQVRPNESLVRNIGNDGSGLHCGTNDHGFATQELSKRDQYIITNRSSMFFLSRRRLLYQGFYNSKARNLISIIKIWLKYMLFRLK